MDSNVEGFDCSDPGRKSKCCGECGSFYHTFPRCLEYAGKTCTNVEYAGKTCTVLYLNKYLVKGNKNMKARFLAMNVSEHTLANEISTYVRGRVIGALDGKY